jgi:hypothetical protein
VIAEYMDIDIFAYATRFETTTSLTFISRIPRPTFASHLKSAFPVLTTLNLVLQDNGSGVQLDEILMVSLKELQIHVESGAERLYVHNRVDLPNLLVFRITKSGGHIIKRMGMTALRTLIFYYSTSETAQQVIDLSQARYSHQWHQLSCLQLHGWNDSIFNYFENGTAELLRKLVPSMLALKSVSLVGGYINGEELVRAMRELAPRKLELTLAFTSGITRDQCDQLKPLTIQLHIYI